MRETDAVIEAERTEREALIARPPLEATGSIAGIFFILGALMFWFQFLPNGNRPATLGEHILLSVWSAMIFAFGAYLLLLCLRHTIIADKDGLRWRGVLGGWQAARWDEITDYYDDHLPKACVVVAGNRTLRLSLIVDDKSENIARIKEQIQARATSARTAEWARLGTRRIDPFPRTFRYWDRTRWLGYSIATSMSLLFGVVVVFGAIVAVRATANMAGWQGTLPLATGIAVLTLTVLYIPFRVIGSACEAYRRRGESITVTPETLCYENTANSQRLEVFWNDVSDYFFQERTGRRTPGRFTIVLRGADEKQITWTGLLRESSLLLAIVQQFAPKPAKVEGETFAWRNKTGTNLVGGSDPATWQSGAVGIGNRVFRNQAKQHRGMLTAYTGLILLYPILWAYVSWANPGRTRVGDLWWITALIAAPTLWGWFCYFRIRVETDETGITHVSTFAKKHLYWYAVADYAEGDGGITPGESIILTGRDGRRMWIRSSLNGYKELKDEIERYAPPPKTGWKTSAEEKRQAR